MWITNMRSLPLINEKHAGDYFSGMQILYDYL